MNKKTFLITVSLVFFTLGFTIHLIFQISHTNEVVSSKYEDGEENIVSEADLINTVGTRIVYNEGDQVATLFIPKISQTYEVFWGTNEETLKKGVGMYVSQWTVTPDQEGHTVLSGHRDTVFRPLGELENGDRLYVTYKGIDYEYIIQKIWITHANDRTVIVEKDEAILTLTTCYPFYYVGSAPERYIIQASLARKGYFL